MGKKGSKTAEAAEIENGGWLVPAWRRVHLLGFPDTVSARMQALMETVVEGAGVEAAEPSFFEHPERLARGDLLLLSQQLAPRLQALEWLATLRKAGHDTPAIVLVAGDPFPPPPELAPVDILASKGLGAHDLARSLGYLRRGLEDSFLADEILKRLRAFGEIRAGDDEHTRAMELAGAYRNQLEEREDELHHARARIAELEAALAGLEPRERSQQDGGSPARGDPAFLARRVRRLEAELEQSEGLRRGQEAAIVELRRRLGEGDDASLPGGVTELTSRLMVSEWMRTAQMQNIQYLHQRLDTLDSCFKALGVLLQTPEGTAELDPAALLEKVGDRLTQFERQRSEQQGTIERLSHSLAVQQVDDTFDDAQSRRNVLHRLDDALAYARTRSAPLACLLAAIDRPEELRAEHGSTAYDFVLVQVAQRLKLSLRHRDVLLRYDNRSFVLITDAESCAAAYNHGTRLVAEVEARPVELGPGRIPVSISIAITFRHPSTHRARDLLRRAQQVLDKASAWGSAQVAIDPRSVRHEKGEE